MGWCDDPYSKDYNKLIKFPFKYSAEKLYRIDNTYDLILVLDFNSNPTGAFFKSPKLRKSFLYSF